MIMKKETDFQASLLNYWLQHPFQQFFMPEAVMLLAILASATSVRRKILKLLNEVKEMDWRAIEQRIADDKNMNSTKIERR